MASITLTPMSNGKWRALVRHPGRRAICKTHRTKAAANAWARPIQATLDAGGQVQTVGVTVSDMIEAYRRMRDDSRPILDTSTEHYTLRQLTAGLGDYVAARLTPQDLVGYARTRREDGAGPYTINMDVSKLGTALRYASVSLGVVTPDVVGQARPLLLHLGLIGGGGKRERRPTEDELTRIVDHMAAGRGRVYADAVLFAVATAMRQAEITRIVWSDVNADKRLVLVRDRKDPRRKAGNDELVPLLGSAWDILQRQPRESLRVFPLHHSTLSKYFTETCRALSIPDLHFHDLRHEGTSRLFEEGYTIEQVAIVTGHKSWNHLKRYTQLRPESLHRDVAAQSSK